MSVATDTFVRFVDVLASTLDNPRLSGHELASRAHLSRFHFDRLVAAAAGEPPATFRRRILLERAAYQLITTDEDVLHVALGAGYSSHEAFTRAFARAYGALALRMAPPADELSDRGAEQGALQPAGRPAPSG